MLAASTFYPPIEQYTIAVMDLHSDAITPQIRALLPRINELASLGDALHALQTLDGHFHNEQTARALLQQSADLLLLIAASLSGSAAEVLRLRAASPDRGSTSPAWPSGISKRRSASSRLSPAWRRRT